MKNRKTFIAAMVVIFALVSGLTYAEETASCPEGKGRIRSNDRQGHIGKRLNLTQEQDERLKESKKAHRAEMEQLAKALKEKRQELKDALAKPGVTRQQLEPIASRIKEIQAQMVDRRIDGILKVKEILTPEQYQQLQGMKEGRQSKKRIKHRGKEW